MTMTARASMRPRLFTAENRVLPPHQNPGPRASMRPRLFTAENHNHHYLRRERFFGFNEAAAFHRGEPACPNGVRVCAWFASMRPRLFTAENLWPRVAISH